LNRILLCRIEVREPTYLQRALALLRQATDEDVTKYRTR
jgi:hypothetical protein